MPTDFLGRVLVVFNRYGMSMLHGAGVSMGIALVGTVIGCAIGFAVGIVQTIPSEKGDNPIKRGVLWVVKLVLNIYVEFFRGTPMMAQAMFIYYGLFPLLNVNTLLKRQRSLLMHARALYVTEQSLAHMSSLTAEMCIRDRCRREQMIQTSSARRLRRPGTSSQTHRRSL